MSGGGPFKPPNYCGECGSPFPWTATALTAAREYTDDLDQLTPEEKDALKSTFADLSERYIQNTAGRESFQEAHKQNWPYRERDIAKNH